VLRSLHVRDYALIDRLEVDFGSGLNVITGETGAGKSILLGALKLILGERASTDVVRTGARKAVVEGVFDEAGGGGLPELLLSHEIEPDGSGVVIVRREVSDTYSRAFVNDTPATLTVLRAVAERLIDLHGQHEHQSLLKVDTHLGTLDDFGDLGSLLAVYREAFDRTAELRRQRGDLVRREQDLSQQRDLIEFQITEIDRLAPEPGEDDRLAAERRILENAERLFEITAGLYQRLYDGEHAVYDQLTAARNELRELSRIDETFETTLREIEQAEIVVEEAAKSLQDYSSRIEINPERLEETRARLAHIDALKRKYGGSLDSVLEHRRRIGETFDLAADFEGAVRRIDADLETQRAELSRAAARLSTARREAASRVESMITAELAALGIPQARFEVRFQVEPDPEGLVTLPEAGTVRAQAAGVDRVEFYVSTNPGEPPRPLARTASGGEISRIMLALKTILARNERLPILVFDEIDVGISGETARRVGETMHRLAACHQIVAITHLPQIAAMGDHHYLVEKRVAEDAEAGLRATTNIRRLQGEERARQVAALVAGTEVSEAALASARELIATGRR
jgi:DNA repair protein RecN (Recombination protein N)